jgi:hypothetical protein
MVPLPKVGWGISVLNAISTNRLAMSQTERSFDTEDPNLRALLRENRPAPAFPPGFENAVWRRIELAEARSQETNWLEALAAWLLRPRLAVAAALALVVAGASLGVAQGSRSADELAKARYLNSISPPELRR